MDKQEHGRRLRAAMAAKGIRDRQTIADATGVQSRTVTNWTSGHSMPGPVDQAALRRLLGDYDRDGDPVEAAVRASDLVEWRKDAVISTYKKHLYEQQADAAG